MRPVDRLVAGYLVFLTLIMGAQGAFVHTESWLLLALHALIGLMLYLFTRVEPFMKTGEVIRDLYPLALLPVLYGELGVLSLQSGIASTYTRDAVIQHWEALVFGGQVAYDWIRAAPSVFWSGVLHLAYLSYYPIIILGPVLLVARGRAVNARRVILSTMIAFVVCYTVFALYPVAGPNYTFDHPTGPVREVWSARLVYWMLGGGSAFGTAFPSSHVAASVATTVALFHEWRKLAAVFLVPNALLVVGTVYLQMHYGIDAAVGLVVGISAGLMGVRIKQS
ncbi:MAG: phosphatase PAP2 family protein [Gemmatimonadales bacterium]